MARIAVVGVGAIGGAVAGLLKTTGRHAITLCTRRPLEKLTVKTSQEVIPVAARNLTDPSQAEPVDWVLVATKAYDTQGTVAWIQALSQGAAPVAILQNGVEHRERFAPFLSPVLSPEKIVPVIIDCPVERQPDGTVLQRGPAHMTVEAGPLGEEFANLFAGSAADVRLTDDFVTAAWRKLCLNSAGILPTLLLQPVGVLRDELLGDVALAIVAECVAVGRAEGARLEDSLGREMLEKCRAQPPDSVNSMLADRMAGRPMEIDARNGAIVRKGDKHGIRTPSNRMAVALLQALRAFSL